MILAWALGVALAQEPVPVVEEPVAVPVAEEELAPPSEDPYEIVVWGENVIRQRRAEIVETFAAHGWTLKERGDGWYVFVPPRGWMGRAKLSREGTLVFGRPLVVIDTVATPDAEYSPDGTLDRTDQAAVVPAISFQVLPSKRKIMAARQGVLEAVDPKLDAYHEALWATRFQAALDALPARLDQLWNDGLALDRGAMLQTKAQRRAAVLDFWATRAETPEGDRTREAVQAWLANVVQPSPDPLTDTEIADAEKRAGRQLL